MTDHTDASAAAEALARSPAAQVPMVEPPQGQQLVQQPVQPQVQEQAPAAAVAEAAGSAVPAFEGIDWVSLHGRDPQAATALWGAYQGLRLLAASAPQERPAPEAVEPPVSAPFGAPAAPVEAEAAPSAPAVELPAQVTAFGVSKGFSAQEMSGVNDPRVVGMLQLAMIGEQALIRHAQAQAFGGFRPPTQVGGRGHPGPLSDHTTTDAWMEARHTQLRKKARN